MSSPPPAGLPQEDVNMGGPAESEGEGDVVMPADDDSSEESDDDQEEEARIREGFIVDEDEEDEEEDEDEEEERRRRRKKRRHRRRQREQVLEEDDLALLEENTGASFKKSRLKRLRRGRESESPPVASSSKRREELESSEDDLDLPQVKDIQSIWDDERAGDGDEYMDDFIEYDEEGEQGAHENEERGAPRSMKPKRRRAFEGRPELEGLDALAWDEIHDVFGDGHEYDWALEDDRPEELEDIAAKLDLKYADVFEPSVIKSHMKTDEDEVIRVQDIPERMQLSVSNLSSATSLSPHGALSEEDLNAAAAWVTERISNKKAFDFFSPDGPYWRYQEDLVRAVTFALRHLFIRSFEVPYIWTHKNDYLSTFDVHDPTFRASLLDEEDLWRVYELGQQFRALVNRNKLLNAAYARLNISDDYFETDIRPRIESVEDAIDAGEWLTMKYKGKKQDSMADYHFYDDAEPVDIGPKHKLPTRTSAYEVAKKSVVSRLANGFGIRSHEIVQNVKAGQNTNFVEDQDLPPLVYAEQFVDPDPEKALPPEELLSRARMIIATELGKDPILRHDIRDLYQREALFSCLPTEKGITKIGQFDKVFTSKYLKDKRIGDLVETDQFLNILKAEADGSLTVSITLPPEVVSNFESKLRNAFSSDGFTESVKLWNAERLLVINEVLEKHLIPAGTKWAREYVKLQEEEFLANVAGQCLLNRIDTPPYYHPKDERREMPHVLAMSWGQGEVHKDPISMITLDNFGRIRDSTAIDNLVDQDNRDEFIDLVSRREITVIVVGGFSAATAKLSARVKEILRAQAKGDKPEDQVERDEDGEVKYFPPVVYAYDDVARLYMQSQRALEEFPYLSKTQRYCVALGRYLQSPLNEFAALGEDISVVKLVPDNFDQSMIPKEKLLKALEKALVTVVQRTGVDINRAVNDRYYAHLLPLVCGLGRRKADLLISKIAQLGGSLINRDQFVKNDLLTHTIFMNAASFLRITQDSDVRHMKGRHSDDDVPDPLDNSRIHPEDYELARKMATDALELDEEDIHDEHPSYVVSQLLQDSDRHRKVNELSLDEFAINLLEANQERKRYVLDNIRRELLLPYGELRGDYKFILDRHKQDAGSYSASPPFPKEKREKEWVLDRHIVLVQLTGESQSTVGKDCTVTGVVTRIAKNNLFVRLDSGLEGVVEEFEDQTLTKGKAVTLTVRKLIADTKKDDFRCILHLGGSGKAQREYKPDENCWDHSRYERDQEMIARKKKAEVNRSRRVIKHPNFHNFNSSQAEAYLEHQQRGDVVIRPSSKGQDHLAVTWKVDTSLYQHIDVTEPGADISGLGVSELIVDSAHRYTDLDELIVNHVQAMARRIDELTAHDKFKPGSEDDLHLYLKNYLLASPDKSMYGFTLNRKRPGHFNLCFLANKDSPVQTWPVRVTPEAYYLFDAPAAGVSELCDAFKVRYLHMQQTQAMGPSGGKTPYGRTPGHMSMRQPARTPNPYGGASSYAAPPSNYGGGSAWGGGTAAPPTSSWGGPNGALPPVPPPQSHYPPQTPSWSGQQTPRNPAPPPPPQPSGIHPSRMEMLQQQSDSRWGASGWS